MQIVVVGAGLMGPAAAYYALIDPTVDQVILVDRDPEALALARGIIDRALDYRDVHAWKEDAGEIRRGDRALLLRAEHPARYPLETVETDVDDPQAAADLFGEASVVISALPWHSSLKAIRGALHAGVPVVDLAIPDDADLAPLAEEAEAAGTLLMLGCGLEPGLSEIETRRLAEKLDAVREIAIMVGGIPDQPSGRLGYKIVFGGTQLPLRQIPALVVENGKRIEVPRYSGTTVAGFAGVGRLEAWHEGVIEWMLELEELSGVERVVQKTIRWPGYAEKAGALNELGLLGTEPIEVGDREVVPKDLVDAILAPDVTFGPDDRDITLFRVEVTGTIDGEPRTLRTEMIDRYDERTGFTSMARTTAFTGAIIARMIADGTVEGTGLHTPDEMLSGTHVTRLFDDLARVDVTFRTDSHEPVQDLLDREGRILVGSEQPRDRIRALRWIATHFDPVRTYSRQEVQTLIRDIVAVPASVEEIYGEMIEREMIAGEGEEIKRCSR